MRKLAVETRDAILADLRVDIPLMRHQWNFQPEYVRVISGVEEGLFGWIAVNYALNRFDSRRFFTIDRFPGISLDFIFTANTCKLFYNLVAL